MYMPYTIGEIAKYLNIPSSTLRFYDKMGLMPFVDRSESGIRLFKDSDIEWLLIIDCLKKSGMPVKNIREFIKLVEQGDASIDKRLEMFQQQHRHVEETIASLEEQLKILKFKCWYYKTAKEAGTTKVPRNMKEDELPEEFRPVRHKLRRLNEK